MYYYLNVQFQGERFNVQNKHMVVYVQSDFKCVVL